MQKQYLTLLFNMRFIFGLIILSNIFLEARDYKILGNTSHRNTQTKKVIPSTSNQKVKCQKDRLFNIDIKGTTSIATYISTITHQCNIVMKVEADVNKLMQTIPKSKSIKQENLIGIFDILLNSYGMRYELNKHVLKISAVKPPATVLKKKVTKTPSPPSLKKTTHAAPKIYASLGNELEVLQQSCELYQKSTMISDDIKTKCQAYNKKVAKAFKVGYKLDPLANSNNISEAKLNEYLNLLRSADENREKLTSFISSKIKKARLEDNVDQYIQLIEASHVNLSSRDYAFMGKHPGKMQKNPKYIRYLASAKQQKEEEKRDQIRLETNQNKQHLAMKKYLNNCTKGDSQSCIVLGNEYLKSKDTNSANHFFNKACSLGNNIGCERLIATYKVYSKTDNTMKAEIMMKNENYIDAYKICIEECDIKNTIEACFQLTGIYLIWATRQTSRKDTDKFINLSKHYHTKGKALSFMKYGINLYNKHNKVAASGYFEYACNHGDSTGCKFYKILYNNGY